MTVWARTFRKRHGTTPEPLVTDDPDGAEGEEATDEADGAYAASYDGWDKGKKNDDESDN